MKKTKFLSSIGLLLFVVGTLTVYLKPYPLLATKTLASQLVQKTENPDKPTAHSLNPDSPTVFEAALEQGCQHEDFSFKCVNFVKNYDGDSITVDIPHIHSFFGNNAKVRVTGIDTPELRTKDTCEKEKARTAKRLVTNLLKRGRRIDLVQIDPKKKFDKYGRILADVSVDGQLLSHYLLKNGLAYTYQGEKKPKMDWCRSQREIASDNTKTL